MSEPECKCFSPSQHEPGCAWKMWKDGGKPVIAAAASSTGQMLTIKPGVYKVPINVLRVGPDVRVFVPAQYRKNLMDSIRDVGQLKPILVSKEGLITDGVQRWRAMIDLGYTEILVMCI